MSLFAQHGWGKSDKIDTALEKELIEGVILSPRDETPAKLAKCISDIREHYEDAEVIVDPQYYASTLVEPRVGRLTDYDYFEMEKPHRDFVGNENISAIVEGVMSFQAGLEVTKILSPTVGFDSFSDRWRLISANLAVESLSYWRNNGDDRPVVVSILLNESALTSHDELDSFLDSLTDLECDGFYFVINRQMDDYRQNFPAQALAGLMYLAYVLAGQNGYSVYIGYSDYCSVPLHAVGVTATACGWTAGLRRFNFGRFEHSSGGRQPRERYSSRPLLNNVYLNPELDAIANANLLQQVLTDTEWDEVLDNRNPSSATWPNAAAALHHWASLSTAVADIERRASTVEKLDRLEAVLTSAENLYGRLRTGRVILSPESGASHLAEWRAATEILRARIRR